MCVQCVAQGAPYVVGSVAALKVMGLNARRARLRRGGADSSDIADTTSTSDPAPAR